MQCDVGHVLCSPCRDRLKDKRRCHVCRGRTTGGFRRCHAMESVVESARVACPNAAWRSPGDACSFVVGRMEVLLVHLADAGVHGWPCSARVRTCEMSSRIRLKDGFNLSRAVSVLLHPRAAAVDDQRPCCLKKMTCELITNSMDDWLQTKFVVTCADLSGGRRHNPDERFQVVVPDCVLDNGENAPISVEFCIQRFP
ncbi:uncharacterized protein LOC120700583 [Panicum virgatum]|uniref:uncharacterized protein LOC120700583 n=1 Tax=Panicum virgatum TaxID=38727 RepID=UPI0019D5343F|nr:uncharacterized protein LOC120700583 [Panicum virgatum]